jgi:hypothetical protein
MKVIHLLVFIVLVMACSPEDATPVAPVSDQFDVVDATLKKQGTVVGIGHTAEGVATVYEKNGRLTVVLDPYSSQNGPDLKVYLSKDEAATEYIRLGNLKSVTGRQSYEVPGQPDLNQYHYVHVWCERFTVVFARAEIK